MTACAPSRPMRDFQLRMTCATDRVRSTGGRLLLVVAFPCQALLMGCQPPPTVTTARKANGITVVLEEIAYPRDGGRGVSRQLHLKALGFPVNEKLGAMLFPEDSPCHAKAHVIDDVRILDDQTVLAFFTSLESPCGYGRLAKISMDGWKLKLTRIDLPTRISELEDRYAGSVRQFGFAKGQEVVYAYADGEEMLAALRDMKARWVFVTAVNGPDNMAVNVEAQRAFAVDLSDGSLRDLGLGEVVRVLRDGTVALVWRLVLSDPRRAYVEYRAVGLTDGKVLDVARMDLVCFEIASQELKEKESYDLANREHYAELERRLAVAAADAQRTLCPQDCAKGDNSPVAGTDRKDLILSARNYALSSVLTSEHVKADLNDAKLILTYSDQVRRKPNCRPQTESPAR